VGRAHQFDCVAPLAAIVKGFGCQPVVTYPVLRAGVRKPPRKELLIPAMSLGYSEIMSLAVPT
jgi:hypothetical protein